MAKCLFSASLDRPYANNRKLLESHCDGIKSSWAFFCIIRRNMYYMADAFCAFLGRHLPCAEQNNSSPSGFSHARMTSQLYESQKHSGIRSFDAAPGGEGGGRRD
jgi:hypothetical protein